MATPPIWWDRSPPLFSIIKLCPIAHYCIAKCSPPLNGMYDAVHDFPYVCVSLLPTCIEGVPWYDVSRWVELLASATVGQTMQFPPNFFDALFSWFSFSQCAGQPLTALCRLFRPVCVFAITPAARVPGQGERIWPIGPPPFCRRHSLNFFYLRTQIPNSCITLHQASDV